MFFPPVAFNILASRGIYICGNLKKTGLHSQKKNFKPFRSVNFERIRLIITKLLNDRLIQKPV